MEVNPSVGVPEIRPLVAFQVTKSASPVSWPSAVRTITGGMMPLTFVEAMAVLRIWPPVTTTMRER